jgi:hypothetical protein
MEQGGKLNQRDGFRRTLGAYPWLPWISGPSRRVESSRLGRFSVYFKYLEFL